MRIRYKDLPESVRIELNAAAEEFGTIHELLLPSQGELSYYGDNLSSYLDMVLSPGSPNSLWHEKRERLRSEWERRKWGILTPSRRVQE